MPPVALWSLLTGQSTFISVFMVFHLYMTAFSAGASIFFLGWQLIIVSQGQTSYEAWKGITVYRGSLLDNIYSVFGDPMTAITGLFLPLNIGSPRGDALKWQAFGKSDKVF